MRSVALIAAIVALNISAIPICASSSENKSPDPEAIAALEARASQAQLIRQLTELSIHQYEAGNTDKATSLLRRVQGIAQKLHVTLANNDKRLKDAEILLNQTAFRLGEMLHASSIQDRPVVKETLAQVSEAQNDTMMQVFRK
jgi:hypothetical protein